MTFCSCVSAIVNLFFRSFLFALNFSFFFFRSFTLNFLCFSFLSINSLFFSHFFFFFSSFAFFFFSIFVFFFISFFFFVNNLFFLFSSCFFCSKIDTRCFRTSPELEEDEKTTTTKTLMRRKKSKRRKRESRSRAKESTMTWASFIAWSLKESSMILLIFEINDFRMRTLKTYDWERRDSTKDIKYLAKRASFLKEEAKESAIEEDSRRRLKRVEIERWKRSEKKESERRRVAFERMSTNCNWTKMTTQDFNCFFKEIFENFRIWSSSLAHDQRVEWSDALIVSWVSKFSFSQFITMIKTHASCREYLLLSLLTRSILLVYDNYIIFQQFYLNISLFDSLLQDLNKILMFNFQSFRRSETLMFSKFEDKMSQFNVSFKM